ncbi:flavin reductase family protein, partial [Kocuria sp.]
MGRFGIARFLHTAAGILSYPQDPRSFAQIFGALSSAHYTRGRITRIQRETPDTVTAFFAVGEGWIPHQAGQWARIGVEVDGKRIWRPYSISAPEAGDPSVTVKAQGVVSEHLVHRATPGDVLYLERPEGQFVLPDMPTELLFVVAGSGITPVMSMLRTLMPRRPDHDVVLVYVSRNRQSCIFHDEILELADQFPGLRPVFWFTEERGRLDASDAATVSALCPDHPQRSTYACGPDSFVTAVEKLGDGSGTAPVVERFNVTRAPTDGQRGEIRLERSDLTVEVGESETILEAAEHAEHPLPHGCRMGICHSCLIPLTDGAVTNIRTGELHR